MSIPFLKSSLIVAAFSFSLVSCRESEKKDMSWEIYRGDGSSNAYSQLKQINTSNVKQLKPAWIYRTSGYSENTTMECNPIIVRDTLYGLSPTVRAFALDAKTGKQLWVFNPFEENSKRSGFYRGLTYWRSKNEQRLFMFAANRVIALDPKTGAPIKSFGDRGAVDLNKGLRLIHGAEQREDVRNTSPGVIYKDLIIIGSSLGEDYESSPGHIRAYDVRTGQQRWIFHTIPEPGEFGYETWPKEGNSKAGGCNAWSGLSIDPERGIVFAATGSPTFDFHGGERIGENLFGNTILALNAATGKRIWHYQTLHHDLWDYDLPAPPNLVTLKKDGKTVDAVAQVTKQGFIFLFERETGKPLFPIQETPVPASKMPAEQSWPTQPIPVKPRPLGWQKFDESTITDISPEAHDFVLNKARKFAWGGIYLPPAPEGILQMPGMRGGGEWSGGCVDKETGIMYVGINNMASEVELVEKQDYSYEFSNRPLIKAGEFLYQKNCAVCHGADRKGNGAFPSLASVGGRLTPGEVSNLLVQPSARMPSFSALQEADRVAIIAFLFNQKDKRLYQPPKRSPAEGKQKKKRYSLKGYLVLTDQNGYPGTKPPWGTLNAVNLNTGESLWQIPLGEYPELAARGIPTTGTQLFGGGIVTAGGLIFIGASADAKFRAIDKVDGKILWEYQLPCGGYATPSTYEADGKQYVVIAAGGGGIQATKSGDYYFAFALP